MASTETKEEKAIRREVEKLEKEGRGCGIDEVWVNLASKFVKEEVVAWFKQFRSQEFEASKKKTIEKLMKRANNWDGNQEILVAGLCNYLKDDPLGITRPDIENYLATRNEEGLVG